MIINGKECLFYQEQRQDPSYCHLHFLLHKDIYKASWGVTGQPDPVCPLNTFILTIEKAF